MIRKTGYLAALLALVVMGCAGHDELSVQNKPDNKTFWSHRYQYIRLVPQDHCQGVDTIANNHPQDLGDRLRLALASLRIDLPDREKTVPVFTHSELEKITGPLLRAFENATPDEDIAIAIEGAHQGTIGFQRTITTARLFIQNNELQIVFGQLHEPFDEYDTPIHAERRDFRLNPLLPGSRCEKAGKKFPSIIPTQMVLFHEQGNIPRKNWVAINLAAQPQVPQAPMAMPPTYRVPAQTAPPAYQTPAQAAPPAYQAPRQTAPPAAQDANRMVPAPAQQPAKTILERLQILKDLRVKGLITEQEYQEKKKEILNSL